MRFLLFAFSQFSLFCFGMNFTILVVRMDESIKLFPGFSQSLLLVAGIMMAASYIGALAYLKFQD